MILKINDFVYLFSLASDDLTFYFLTNVNAPRYKIVKYDLSNHEQVFNFSFYE